MANFDGDSTVEFPPAVYPDLMPEPPFAVIL
jgi:hypothetical protein